MADNRIENDRFVVDLMETVNGLKTTTQITLSELALELETRTSELLKICEEQTRLLAGLFNSNIKLVDRIDALEQQTFGPSGHEFISND